MREIRWPKYQWCSLHNYNIGVDCPSCERASIANTNIEACIKAWQEAQAGEYIKQAVDNGYSLKSDKPPLSALDAQELSAFICEWYKIEKISFLYDGVNILSKAICSKFGTPPSVRNVSVEEIEKLKSIIKYQIDARGGRINPKDDFNGFINDIYGVLNG